MGLTIVEHDGAGVVSSANSSTTPLGSSGVFTGTGEDVSRYSQIGITVFSDQASADAGLRLEFSSDGTNWDIVDSFTVPANTGKVYTVGVYAKFFRVVFTNGTGAQTVFRLQVICKLFPFKASNHALDVEIDPDDDAELVLAVLAATRENGKVRASPAGNDGSPIVIARNKAEAIQLGQLTGVAGHRFGYTTTTSTGIGTVRATLYVEPPAPGLEVLSSSNGDQGNNPPGLGSGTRKLRVVYYRDDGSGPFEEIVTMNGTTAVALADGQARFVELMETDEVGANGSNAGTITIRRSSGGATVGTIATGDGITFWAHHYVAAGRKCFIKDYMASANGNSMEFWLWHIPSLKTDGFTKQISQALRVVDGQNSVVHNTDIPVLVDLFGRVEMKVRSDSAASNSIKGGFTFYELL